MTILLEQETKVEWDFPYKEVIEEVILAAMDFEGCPYEAEISVTLTDNEGIRQINREFRGIDRPTDVLSFPMIEYQIPGDFSHVEDETDENFNPETGELLLGDILISTEKVEEQAEKYGHSLKRELAFLTAHSMFHLFGYDHMEEEERIRMEQKQNKLLDMLGIGR